MMLDLDALEDALRRSPKIPKRLAADELSALVKIARAAIVWQHARTLQTGTPFDHSMLADAIAIALDNAGLT